MQIELSSYTPLHGDGYSVMVDAEKFDVILARYRELYPLDDRPFEGMSSDIQHALIRVALSHQEEPSNEQN